MSGEDLEFRPSRRCSVGVELELQILNSHDYNLARDAADLLALLEKQKLPGAIKPEITESMIELNTSVHEGYPTLSAELEVLRAAVADAARRLNVRIAGGGSHPFHKWSERRIYPTERFRHLLKVYGYLAKQFTVFGQHVHLGCADGDEALYLTHALARYVPHFIALSASSPFQQAEDTAYQSSRLNTVSAFPLSGQVPFVLEWREFVAYFEKMRAYGIVASMKDFYWDVRPKPEYGTVEIRVFDTPLTVERAAAIATYARAVARWLLEERPLVPDAEVYLPYNYNRFQACRYGLEATVVDAYAQREVKLRDQVLDTLEVIGARGAGADASALERIARDAASGPSDADWLREKYRSLGSMNDVAREQSNLWMDALRGEA
jgi:carboxylate-amine ligase